MNKIVPFFLMLFMLLGCKSKKDEANKIYNKSLAHYDSGKYDSAIILLQQTIKIDTSNANAKYILAKCYYRLKNYDAAISSLNSVKNQFTPADSIYKLYADVYGQKDDFDKAIDFSEKMILLNANNFDAYLLKGKYLYNKANKIDNLDLYKKAFEVVSIANRIKPNDNSCLLLRGVIRFGIKDYDGSIKDLSSVISHEQTNSYNLATSYRFIGSSLYKQQKLEKALLYYDTSLIYQPNESNAYRLRAFVKIDLKMNESACEDFRKSLELGDADSIEEIQEYCKNKTDKASKK